MLIDYYSLSIALKLLLKVNVAMYVELLDFKILWILLDLHFTLCSDVRLKVSLFKEMGVFLLFDPVDTFKTGNLLYSILLEIFKKLVLGKLNV